MTNKLDKAYEAALSATKKKRAPRKKSAPAVEKLHIAAEKIKLPKAPDLDHEGDDLLLFAENDWKVYDQMRAIQKNLAKKMQKGTYEHSKAITGWMHAANHGSQEYKKQIGVEGIDMYARGTGSHAFSPAIRKAVAAAMAWKFLSDAQMGNYDDI